MLAGNGCPERLAEAGPGQRRIGSSGVALDRCRRVVSTERGQHVLFETVGKQGNDQCFVYLPRLLAQRWHSRAEHRRNQHGNTQVTGTDMHDFTDMITGSTLGTAYSVVGTER